LAARAGVSGDRATDAASATAAAGVDDPAGGESAGGESDVDKAQKGATGKDAGGTQRKIMENQNPPNNVTTAGPG